MTYKPIIGVGSGLAVNDTDAPEHGIAAWGILQWGGAAFSWFVNHGFQPVGGAGAPTHVAPGQWTVTTTSAVSATAALVGFTLGVPGWCTQNGPTAGNTFSVSVKDVTGTPSNPPGWAAGAVLGTPVDTDSPGVLIIVFD
jgi:hypothetical protein